MYKTSYLDMDISDNTTTKPEEAKVDSIPKIVFGTSIPLLSKNKKIVYIVRGLPGSGKSTFCRNLLFHILDFPCIRDQQNGFVVKNASVMKLCYNYILSTDDFFTKISDEGNMCYNYNPRNVVEYHQKNKTRAEIQSSLGVSPLFIDNTNVDSSEILPYLTIFRNKGYAIHLLSPKDFYGDENYLKTIGDLYDPKWLYANRNPKKIKFDVYNRMQQRWEEEIHI